MKVTSMNWMQVEEYLKSDDRAVLPIGSTEQHGYLSLGVDLILSEKMSIDSAEPLNVPVFPTVNYGSTPNFMSYPGTVSLRMETLWAVVHDVLGSLQKAGFRRIVCVNGHGGNSFLSSFIREWMTKNPEMQVKFHNWWNAPKTWEAVQKIDPVASHASWMENFPWTRLANVTMPTGQKKMIDIQKYLLCGDDHRDLLGDGNFGGDYQKDDEVMHSLWEVAVSETQELIEKGWR